MRRVVFLTTPDARHGFNAGGASQQTVAPGEAAATLERTIADPDTGVVVVDERLLAEIGEERFRAWERQWHGILVVLPAPERERPEGEDYALRLIRRAIGYHIRLEL